MTTLPFEKFVQIYKDRANENDHSKYINLKTNLCLTFEGVSDIDNCNSKDLESKVTVKSFQKSLTSIGENPATITGNFIKFSDYSVNDPLFDSLRQLETFFKLNLTTPDHLQKKIARISQYLDEHPKRKLITNAEVKKIHNILLDSLFDKEKMTIVQANQVLETADEDICLIIDNKIDKLIREKN
jgi:hypothetical protein